MNTFCLKMGSIISQFKENNEIRNMNWRINNNNYNISIIIPLIN